MKLIHKTTLYYVVISVPLVGLAAFISYFVIKAEIKNGTKEVLYTDNYNAKHMIRSFSHPQNITLSSDGYSKIKMVSKPLDKTIFIDTLIYDPIEEETVEFTFLKSNYWYKNQLYQIDIIKNNLDAEELLEGLWEGFGILLLFLGFGYLLLNWFISKTIWKPFYKTIYHLENYEINQHENFQLVKVSTNEFNNLNKSLNTMTNKIQEVFVQHKEFTENASHEMQTPLAVIKANLSLLMQTSNLTEVEMNSIQTIENSVKKLTALNRTLLLLTKIDNQQFSEQVLINFTELCDNVLKHYSELISLKEINVEKNFHDHLWFTMNPTLAEILISNLIQNAIRHNVKGGKIKLSSTINSFVIGNTGEPLSIPESDLFIRFRKGNTTSDSVGLGLSIVKSIVENNQCNIRYENLNSSHLFIIDFINND